MTLPTAVSKHLLSSPQHTSQNHKHKSHLPVKTTQTSANRFSVGHPSACTINDNLALAATKWTIPKKPSYRVHNEATDAMIAGNTISLPDKTYNYDKKAANQRLRDTLLSEYLLKAGRAAMQQRQPVPDIIDTLEARLRVNHFLYMTGQGRPDTSVDLSLLPSTITKHRPLIMGLMDAPFNHRPLKESAGVLIVSDYARVAAEHIHWQLSRQLRLD
nr:hypothetical protein [uncultured Arsenicibacter sp.]